MITLDYVTNVDKHGKIQILAVITETDAKIEAWL